MKLIALCGAAGAGKDTVADMLPARKLAFADTLYWEVAEAFRITVDKLKHRQTKELGLAELDMKWCRSEDFSKWHSRMYPLGNGGIESWAFSNISPRQALQWWGDFRRVQNPEYFTSALFDSMPSGPTVITDVRFPNEAALVRQLGGQLWQIRRPGYEAGGTGHASDTDGSEFRPDVVLENFGSLDDLRRTVLDAWEYRG